MAKSVDVVIYKGIKYRRYPDSKGASDQRHYVPGITDRQRLNLGRLHEEIWKAKHGPIPAGHHVHHLDHNHLNNDVDNLVCIVDAEHKSHHARAKDFVTPARRAHLDEIRPLAAEWHGGEAGLAWHREHGKRTWEGREYRTGICERCGSTYSTRNSHAMDRFCSEKCKAAARRDSGVDNEERTCERCRAQFVVNRYAKTRFCSRSCGRRSRLA